MFLDIVLLIYLEFNIFLFLCNIFALSHDFMHYLLISLENIADRQYCHIGRYKTTQEKRVFHRPARITIGAVYASSETVMDEKSSLAYQSPIAAC